MGLGGRAPRKKDHIQKNYSQPAPFSDFLSGALDVGADPNARNFDGSTALFACSSTRTLQVLLERGASPHAVTDAGTSAAATPLMHQSPTLLDALLAWGLGDVPVLGADFPVHVCVRNNFVQGLLRVVKHGCWLDVPSAGASALDLAVQLHRKECGVQLLAAGAKTLVEKVPHAWQIAAAVQLRLRAAALRETTRRWTGLCKRTKVWSE